MTHWREGQRGAGNTGAGQRRSDTSAGELNWELLRSWPGEFMGGGVYRVLSVPLAPVVVPALLVVLGGVGSGDDDDDKPVVCCLLWT